MRKVVITQRGAGDGILAMEWSRDTCWRSEQKLINWYHQFSTTFRAVLLLRVPLIKSLPSAHDQQPSEKATRYARLLRPDVDLCKKPSCPSAEREIGQEIAVMDERLTIVYELYGITNDRRAK
jgi:hypothetical protein